MVGICFGRNNGFIDCIDNGEFTGNQSSDCEPGEVVANRVIVN
jgi:hypothetical protein